MLIAIAGRTIDAKGQVCSMGSGKSAVADILIKKFGFVQMGLADPMRRFCQEVYQFSDDQVWGPSEARNSLDQRYSRDAHDFDEEGKCRCCGTTDPNTQCYLTARYALQTLGTEWSRNCDPLTWPRNLVKTYEKLQRGGVYYDKQCGFRYWSDMGGDAVRAKTNVVVCDVRYLNELNYIRSNGGFTILVERRVEDLGHTLNSSHPSETGLNEAGASQFSAQILNFKGLKELEEMTERAYLGLTKGQEHMLIRPLH